VCRVQVTLLSTIVNDLLFVAVLLPSVILHEVSHGLVAERFGDSTARDAGRITANPLVHIDPVGTILVPAVLAFTGAPVFGWAKPVPVVPSRLRRPVRDMALVGVAGPVTNVVLAVIGGRVLLPPTSGWIAVVIWYFAYVNVVLAVFNLLPVPPLDGSRLLPLVLGERGRAIWSSIEPFGLLIVFAVLFIPRLSVVLSVPIKALAGVAGLV
jgi:Zn-dependent protease